MDMNTIVNRQYLTTPNPPFLSRISPVTMFKLLTGYRPFTDDNFNTFVEMATTMNALVREHCDSPEYAILFQEVPFPSFLSPEAKDLIRYAFGYGLV
ncbi:hypothetical protein EON63_22350 [archaeon]|nr:MAG: hypothetical protein EON63_22350 [archaeon]